MKIDWNKLYHECNKAMKSNVNTEQQNIYNEGIGFWYWCAEKRDEIRIMAKYDNLKQEILSFKQFSAEQWTDLNKSCNILIQVDKIKTIASNGNNERLYEIKKGQSITLQHLLSIKLYTDYTSLCRIFCEAFRLRKITDTEYERLQSLKNRNRKVANWAKLLIESVQCFGRLRTNNKPYYRGVSSAFIFKQFITRYKAPLSTTTDFNKAAEYAQNSDDEI
eukprot:233807_1